MNPDLSLETELTIALRLTVGLVLGAIIGFERELHRTPAGFRTHSIVALGAALFTVVSAYGFSGIGVDPTRIAAQIVTGIGFIGAGTILQYRGQIRGLTTAASLWAVAAIGMAAGAGLFVHGHRSGPSSSWSSCPCSTGSSSSRGVASDLPPDQYDLSEGDRARRRQERGPHMTLTTTHLEGLPLDPPRQGARDVRGRRSPSAPRRHRSALSAFDVVFDQPIPDKGAVLTRLSTWWFERARDGLGRSHFVSADPAELPEAARTSGDGAAVDARAAGRAGRRRVRRARLPRRIRVGGVPAHRGRVRPPAAGRAARGRTGFRSRSSRPRRRPRSGTTRTSRASSSPTWWAASLARPARGALDRPLPRGSAARRIGRPDPGRHEVRVRVHRRRAGGDRRGPDPRLVSLLGRRALRAGSSPPSFDKQFVRDFVAASGWNKEPPAPTLPDEVIAGTRDRYVAAYERLTGPGWS